MSNPKRGEIWLVDLNPTRGQEIQKTRPVVIISSDLFNPIAIRIAIPITGWQEKFGDRPFMVRIDANPDNGWIKTLPEIFSKSVVFRPRDLSTSLVK